MQPTLHPYRIYVHPADVVDLQATACDCFTSGKRIVTYQPAGSETFDIALAIHGEPILTTSKGLDNLRRDYRHHPVLSGYRVRLFGSTLPGQGAWFCTDHAPY